MKGGSEVSFESYVGEQYNHVLGRRADDGGLRWWTDSPSNSNSLSARVNRGEDIQSALKYIHDTALASSAEGQARIKRLGVILLKRKPRLSYLLRQQTSNKCLVVILIVE